MSGTTFCDSSGVTELALGRQDAVAKGVELRLVVTSAQVRQILAITGLDRLLRVYPTMSAALADS